MEARVLELFSGKSKKGFIGFFKESGPQEMINTCLHHAYITCNPLCSSLTLSRLSSLLHIAISRSLPHSSDFIITL